MRPQHHRPSTLLLFIFISTPIMFTTAFPLPSSFKSSHPVVLHSLPDTDSSLPAYDSSTTTSSTFVATQKHLGLLPELLDRDGPLNDLASVAPFTSLHSPAARRPGHTSRDELHEGRPIGFGRTTIWNSWNWRGGLGKGQGCRWHSSRKDVAKQRAIETNPEKVEQEAVERHGKDTVQRAVDEEVVQVPLKADVLTTSANLTPLDILIAEELFASSATSRKPDAKSASLSPASATNAMIDLPPQPSQTQLEQSAFPSGLKGHLVPFERVPMVEFVKAKE